jgi:hypothetical protein
LPILGKTFVNNHHFRRSSQKAAIFFGNIPLPQETFLLLVMGVTNIDPEKMHWFKLLNDKVIRKPTEAEGFLQKL